MRDAAIAVHPRDRRRDRRQQRAVCGESAERPHDRDRDESACVAVIRACEQGYRISDCEDCARLAVGYTLDELQNDITKATPACFEPTIDYVVVKIPKWQFEKFPGADENLGPQMKSVGEVMAIGRTFKEAMMKAVRSLETGKKATADEIEPRRLTQRLVTPHPERLSYVRYAFERGMTVREVSRMTGMDPWFLHQMKQITDEIKAVATLKIADVTTEDLRKAKRMGISDERLAAGWGVTVAEVRALRKKLGVMPVYKMVDTCAGEFESFTPYLYSCYDEEDEAAPTGEAEDHDSGLGAEPHRAGNRVRLLLLPCRVRVARGRLRDHHGELQSGDGFDRLRHLGSSLLRAVDAGGCARRLRARGGERRGDWDDRAVWRADSAESFAATEKGRCACDWDVARIDRPGGGSQALRQAD